MSRSAVLSTNRLSGLTPTRKGAPISLEYDGAQPSIRRRQPRTSLLPEDQELKPRQRKILVSNTFDLRRNFVVAAWMIRKHLDRTSTFTFQSKTGDKALDKDIEFLMRRYSRPENCDVAGMHSLPKMLRLTEACRTVGGDVGLMKMSDGHMQGVEGYRVRTPHGVDVDTDRWNHGIETTKGGKHRAYAICKDDDTLERTVPAGFMFWHGYYDRFSQVRGVSPLAPALNPMRDSYEAGEYALAKMKVVQLFGLKLKRGDGSPLPGEEGEQGTDGKRAAYEFNFGAGPQFLDLDPGDDADFLESKVPSSEFEKYMKVTLALVIKCLDLPFSFYDESFTNYSGAREAWLLYEDSAARKRDDNVQLLNRITEWIMSIWVMDGLLKLPAKYADIQNLRYHWIPSAIPWLDPLKEALADRTALGMRITTRGRIIKQRYGEDADDVFDEIAAEEKGIRERGIEPFVDTEPAIFEQSFQKPQEEEEPAKP